jgi:Protein of unknown function (DUF3572)
MLAKARIAPRRANDGIEKLAPIPYGKANGTAMKNALPLARESAEILAIQALSFIAEEPGRLSAFLSETGVGIEAVRDAAREPGFLAGVLEHMLGDEKLLIAFADSAGIDPADIGRARRALGGTWERDLP